MARRILMTATIFAVIVIVVTACLAERATLVFDTNRPVWDRVPSPEKGEKQIAAIRAGTKMPLYRCIDIKSYFVYEIRLDDGRNGYVDSGSGRPNVRSAFLPPYSQPIVWNCLK